MKRKLLLILSLCTVAVCSVLLFSACKTGDKECVHDYRSVITQPTCTEPGFTFHICSKCNDNYVDDYVNSLGHDVQNHEAKAATCTEVGWEAYEACSRCDYSTYKEISIDSTNHDLQPHKAQAATCTEIGWEAYQTCSRCDYSTYQEIAALNHDIQSHKAQAATCTEVGWEAYQTCSRCEYTTYKEIAVLNHDIQNHKAEAATCTDIGWEVYQTCSRCSYTTYQEIAALNHDVQNHEAQAATCAETGWEAYETCSRCDYTTYRETPALMAHEYANGHCKRCNEQEPTLDNLTFTLKDDNTYEVKGVDKTITEAIIPSLYNGKFVTSIGDSAFGGCGALLSVTVPNGITYIGNYSFKDCASLMSINVPDGVAYIGYYAFEGCASLTSITIPESVNSIGIAAFGGCTSLTVYCVKIAEAAGWNHKWNLSNCPVVFDCKINDVADDGCIYIISENIRYSLKDGTVTVARQAQATSGNITLPQIVTYKNDNYSVTSIDDRAFGGCNLLTSITVPDSVTSIGISAFDSCTSLASITLPFVGNTLNGTENTHFGYIFGATSYSDNSNYVPDSLKTVIINGGSIPNFAFEGCSLLKSITIPDDITKIGNSAFEWCSSLTSINIPDSVTSFGDAACRDCSSLTSINIPHGVTYISLGLFERCTSLTSITIPDSVTDIGNGAFIDCTSLTGIIIPKSVTAIGWYAFVGCDSLTIYCEAESEPGLYSDFWNGDCPVVWGYKGEN